MGLKVHSESPLSGGQWHTEPIQTDETTRPQISFAVRPRKNSNYLSPVAIRHTP